MEMVLELDGVAGRCSGVDCIGWRKEVDWRIVGSRSVVTGVLLLAM